MWFINNNEGKFWVACMQIVNLWQSYKNVMIVDMESRINTQSSSSTEYASVSSMLCVFVHKKVLVGLGNGCRP